MSCEVLHLEPGGTISINYNSDTPIAGFQFDITGVTVTDASGGAAEAAGFMISSSESTVLGFSCLDQLELY